MASAVHQRVDAAPPPQRCIKQALQVVNRLVRAGHADAAEFLRQRLALAGRGDDRGAITVAREPPRRRRAHAAAAGGDDRHFLRH
jgi:hypothetical protein